MWGRLSACGVFSNPPRRFAVKASKRYNDVVPQLQRATVYLDPSLHKALSVKAAHTGGTISETFAEDAKDLAAFGKRAKEPSLSFEAVLKDLRRRGKL